MARLLFLLGCIPVRLALAAFLYYAPAEWLSFVLAVIGIAFLALFATNARLHAPEAGGTTWWAHLRPIHGTLYIVAAILAAKQMGRWSALVILIDTLFGLGAHLLHYYS